ncbi:hypothetical protein Bhyg_12456 [Pseudolycoriella hygida]|uniref:Lipoprotein n=1 Tax=Pseudolycoriella hygida TaxID=35572 RepID=A0A9Q0MYI3_9DIPT|nr:hypothetical protein Bhyg_12456 [Pseudolycoriella hygida]
MHFRMSGVRVIKLCFISLFTSCLKFSKELRPGVIISDNTKHTKTEIACYLFEILSKLPPKQDFENLD